MERDGPLTITFSRVMRLSVLLLIVLAAALVLLNPTEDEFAEFARSHSEGLVEERTGDSALGQALSGAGSSIVESYVRESAHRENYGVYSIYSVDLNGLGKWRFVGVAGQFVELERPEGME